MRQRSIDFGGLFTENLRGVRDYIRSPPSLEQSRAWEINLQSRSDAPIPHPKIRSRAAVDCSRLLLVNFLLRTCSVLRHGRPSRGSGPSPCGDEGIRQPAWFARRKGAIHVDGHEPATGRLASCRRFVFFCAGRAMCARHAARVVCNRGRPPKEILTSPH